MANSYHQLGNVAYLRGDYDQALDWYRKSLEIREALGDRAGMASSYHQLGMVAQARGEYDQALDWYRKSLEINEALGNRAGMASISSNVGALYTEQGAAEEAIPFNLQSLALQLEIGLPARINLHWLTRQREALGAERFGQILREHLDEENAAAVLKMLDDFTAGQAKPD
jgi:tetratricopeptide (TPR) repeat protein